MAEAGIHPHWASSPGIDQIARWAGEWGARSARREDVATVADARCNSAAQASVIAMSILPRIAFE